MRLAPLVLLLSLTAGCRQDPERPVVDNEAGSLAPPVSGPKTAPPPKAMVAFGSQKELVDYLRSRPVAARRRESAAAPPPAAAPTPALAEAAKAGADESVTNVQHAGVDEGGIVKLHGDHLVVLRRGRLFTIHVGDDSLSPVSSVDAFGPDVDPRGAWYDEMLVSGDRVVVIGYSYQRGGTEIGLFDLDRSGGLAYRATYHLRSNDYYSSRNYASRLLGDKLVFYTPLSLRPDPEDPLRRFPAIRKWRRGATDGDFRLTAEPARIYRPLGDPPSLTLHTVTLCDLARPELECRSTGVMGPPGRVFYVSPSSVYVWMTEWRYDPDAGRSSSKSFAYRLPLDGSAPTALRVAGAPVDQFSFLESSDQHLNVLVRGDAAGESMWGSEVTAGDVALLRVPLASFSGAGAPAPSSRYARLPKPSGQSFQNRFVGDWVLYGTGSGWGRPQPAGGELVAYRFAGGGEPVKLDLGHGVDRIEALGRDAIVIGADSTDLHFSPIALSGGGARPSPRFTRRGAAQGELRSHGFFYKPLADGRGLVGLPIREAGSRGGAHLLHGSASVLFLDNDRLRLSELGDLGSRPGSADDGCRASCVDWYGNARPLFLKSRIFALLGYEIVEGRLDDGRIRERRRTSFAPRAPRPIAD
jgi:hypothetical protein